MMRTYPLEEVTQAVTAEQFRDWLLYPEFTATETAVANALLKEATEQIIEYIQRELKPRKRRLEIHEWPTKGTDAGSLRVRNAENIDPIELPFGPVISIDEIIDSDGDALSEDDWELSNDWLDMTPQNEVRIDYTAGYDDDNFMMPERAERAVKMLAAYLWQHRGDEKAGNPLVDSGAASTVQSLRVLTI